MAVVSSSSQTEEGLFRYMDTQQQNRPPTTIVLGSRNEQFLTDQLDHYPDDRFDGRFTIEMVDGSSYYLATNGFEVSPGGVSSSSDGSAAIYWAKRDCGDYGFEIYSLPPWSTTSCHCHFERTEESFWLVTGYAEVKLGSASIIHQERGKSLDGGKITATIGIYHQVITREAGSIILYKAVGPNPLGREDHEFVRS